MTAHNGYPPQAGIVDPGIQDPALAARTFAAFEARPDVEIAPLELGVKHTLRVEDMEPLATVEIGLGSKLGLMVHIEAGEGEGAQVWAPLTVDKDGQLQPDANEGILRTPIGFDPRHGVVGTADNGIRRLIRGSGGGPGKSGPDGFSWNVMFSNDGMLEIDGSGSSKLVTIPPKKEQVATEEDWSAVGDFAGQRVVQAVAGPALKPEEPAQTAAQVLGNEERTTSTEESPVNKAVVTEQSISDDTPRAAERESSPEVGFILSNPELAMVSGVVHNFNEIFRGVTNGYNGMVDRDHADTELIKRLDSMLAEAKANGASQSVEMVMRGIAAGALTNKNKVLEVLEPVFAAGALPEERRALVQTLAGNVEQMRLQSYQPMTEREKIEQAYNAAITTQINWPARDEPTTSFLFAYKIGVASQNPNHLSPHGLIEGLREKRST